MEPKEIKFSIESVKTDLGTVYRIRAEMGEKIFDVKFAEEISWCDTYNFKEQYIVPPVKEILRRFGIQKDYRFVDKIASDLNMKAGRKDKTEYRIIEECEIVDIEKEVKDLLMNGFELVNGAIPYSYVYTDRDGDTYTTTRYVQTLIKKTGTIS